MLKWLEILLVLVVKVSSGVLPQRSGVLPELSGALPELSGAFPQRSGVLPELSGVFPQLSGGLPQLLGAFPELLGSFPQLSGKSYPKNGTLFLGRDNYINQKAPTYKVGAFLILTYFLKSVFNTQSSW